MGVQTHRKELEMPRIIIPTSAPGVTADWAIANAPSGWEAVLYSSDDSSFIYSSTVAQTSDFHCGAGWAPTTGRIMAVTLHYRVRATAIGVNQVDFQITQSGVPHTVGATVNVGTAWQDGLIRVREDWTTTTRFTLSDTAALGAGAEIIAVAATGRIELSRLWLEIEYVYGPTFYDPYDGILPDAIVGPLNWTLVGAGAPGVLAGNYLRVDDVDPLNSIAYMGPPALPYTPNEFRNDFVTEVETRIILSNPTAAPNGYMWMLFDMVDTRYISLAVSKINGVLYLGLIEDVVDPLNQNNYAAITPFSYLNEDIHVRMRIDRNQVPGNYGKVEVFINYAETPEIQASFWGGFPPHLPFFPYIAFGSPGIGASIGRADIDYISWRHFKRDGSLFRGWNNWDFAANRVEVDTLDPDIVKKIIVEPPGIVAGQSNQACVLNVVEPPNQCAVYQIEGLPAPAPTTYKIDVDYKMDIGFTEGELVLQRTSDLWYWDQAGSAWSAVFQSVTLPNQTTRTRLTSAMSSISLASVTNDVLLLTISRKTTGFPAYKILLYRVHLVEE